MTLKKGDIVKIDPDGRFGYQISESEESNGTILDTNSEGNGYYDVDFENGYTNCYTEDDLILIKGNINWKERLGD